MRKRPPQEFFPVIGFLNEQGIVPEIVAGQAVNLWALHYLEWDAQVFSAFEQALASPPLYQRGPGNPFWSKDGLA